MDSDVSFLRVAASGAATTNRVRLRGVYMAAGGVGSVEFRNGLVGGTLLLMLDAAAAGGSNVVIPGGGILFPAGIYVVITGTISGVTMFVG